MTALPVSAYVSLTTFRRTGVPVSAPVWAAPDGETLVVWTRADSGKINTPCPPPLASSRREPAGGLGEAVEGVGEFVPAAGRPPAIAALRRDYGLKFTLGNATPRFWHRTTRRSGDRHEVIRIRPA